MNIYSSSISPATSPLIAVKGVCVVLTGAQADLCDRLAGGFHGGVDRQIASGVCFHRNQKCKGGESRARDVERLCEDFSLEGSVFYAFGGNLGSAPELKQVPWLWCELGATLMELLWIYVWPNPGRVALHL